jgi:hypothetical protein|tara:strand:- start:980 stop:1393 length:414 start_codon:yes stop_codon:yes gene_type:complete
MSNGNPNWDKIAEGKVRHGFAIEAFKKEMPLNKETMDEIDRWVYFVMHGIEGLKKIISDSKKSPDEELVDKVVEATNGEKITDENHVENKIKEAVEGLGKRNANKVMKALKEGKITLGNLDTSLERIQEMKQAQGNA